MCKWIGEYRAITLTTSTDTITGTSGNDTIVGNDATFTTGDNINGGAGTDTLTVTMAAAAQKIATISAVENVEFSAGLADNAGDINAANWTGVSTLKLKGLGVAVADAALGASGWTFVGLANNVKLAAENLTVGTDNHAAMAVQFASNALGSTTATLALDINKVGDSTNDANILVDTQGTDKITKLTVATAGTNYVALEGAAASEIDLTSITVTGAGTNTLAVDGTNAIVTSLATLDASGATGALTMNVSASTKDVTFTGSSGKNTITFGNGNNTITGGGANDAFTVGTGNNTITGGAGDDSVTGTLASFTTADSIALGDGTRDAIIYSDVVTLNSSGLTSAQLSTLNGYTGVEVVGSSAADVTAIDANFFTQSIYQLSGALAKDITMSDVAGDTLILKSSIAAATADALAVVGELPNSSFNLELNGAASLTLISKDAAGTDAGLNIASGVSTVNIKSTTSATSTTGIKNAISADADTTIDGTAATNALYAVNNVSAGSFVLTGNVDFAIDGGKTAGFSKAVDFNAGDFTGKLTFVGSTDADKITGGSGNDTLTGLAGNDVIDLSKGGQDTVVFSDTSNGKDSISGFTVGSQGDILKGTSLDSAVTSLTTSVTSLTGAATMGNSAIYVINMATAIAGKAYGDTGADFGDIFGTGKVFSTTTGGDIETILVVQGTDQTQIFLVDSGDTTIASSEITTIGVLTDVTNASTLHINNFNFS